MRITFCEQLTLTATVLGKSKLVEEWLAFTALEPLSVSQAFTDLCTIIPHYATCGLSVANAMNSTLDLLHTGEGLARETQTVYRTITTLFVSCNHQTIRVAGSSVMAFLIHVTGKLWQTTNPEFLDTASVTNDTDTHSSSIQSARNYPPQ